jgi:small GTP-binding protein
MELLEHEVKQFRVITIGDTCVGKTSLISQLVHGEFNPDQVSTIGAMFVEHVELIRARRVEMQIWDTAEQERFRSLGSIYYRNAFSAVVLFDFTAQGTLERLSSWISAFLGIARGRALLVIVGNKINLEDAIAVKEETVRKWVDGQHYHYFRTRAKTGAGVRDIFRAIAEELLRREDQVTPQETAVAQPPAEKPGCC